MGIQLLETIADEVKPIVVKPPCHGTLKQQRCGECRIIERCPSPVSWCLKPYYDKKRGCPEFGCRNTCPPQVKLFDEVYDVKQPVYMVVCRFDFASYLRDMASHHPSWTDRQLRNVLYWQGTARKQLRSAVADYKKKMQLTDYVETLLPEAMGVDVQKTISNYGIELEFPPVNYVSKIALLGKLNPKV